MVPKLETRRCLVCAVQTHCSCQQCGRPVCPDHWVLRHRLREGRGVDESYCPECWENRGPVRKLGDSLKMWGPLIFIAFVLLSIVIDMLVLGRTRD